MNTELEKGTEAWVSDMKKEVLREARQVQKISPLVLVAIIDRTGLIYRDVHGIEEDAVERAVRKFKKGWARLMFEAHQQVAL